jgi:restriction system protein
MSQNLPQHFRYIIPIVEVLKELGGSGKSSEVTDMVIAQLNISDEELEDSLKSGGSRIRNQIHWARMALVKLEHIDSSQRGVWSLTETGFNKPLTKEDLVHFYKTRKEWTGLGSQKQKDTETVSNTSANENSENIDENIDYRMELLKILKSVSPSGFERICQRLLRESGFERVQVTGKSGDGGIDGHGILQVNPFVSFNILF